MNLEISCRETHALLTGDAEVVLVDCREQQEYDLVHIEGSLLLPMSQLLTRVGEIEHLQKSHLIVYCHHGMRSAQVANWLRAHGFANTQSMAGGIDLWATEIEPGMARYEW